MKRVKYISMVATAVAMTAMASGSAFALTVDSNIALTKHNLSSTGTGNQTVNTTEICVFCHTPHGANISQVVPLWNRTMTAPAAFQTYAALGSATLDGSIAEVGSVSLACLSCHDGQVAMDSLLNAPGSGNPLTNWAFTSPESTMSPAGLLTAGIALIGTDLRDDHPVGILYAAGNVAGNETNAATYTDPDFFAASVTNINGSNYWYVETSGNPSDGRDRADMILYTRTDVTDVSGGTIAGAQPYVECASCHDPHVVAVGSQVAFLRISNEGSELCLACHDK